MCVSPLSLLIFVSNMTDKGTTDILFFFPLIQRGVYDEALSSLFQNVDLRWLYILLFCDGHHWSVKHEAKYSCFKFFTGKIMGDHVILMGESNI